MKNKQLFGMFVAILLLLLIPTNINAKELTNEGRKDEINSELIYTIYSKVDNNKINIKPYIAEPKQKPNVDEWIEDYNQEQDCTGDNSILGSYNDPNSVAYLLQIIFNWIKLIGPFIVVVMSGIDFAKVIVLGDDEGMKKAQKKLIIRLILAASLFLLPDLIGSLLEIFNITSSGICGLQ